MNTRHHLLFLLCCLPGMVHGTNVAAVGERGNWVKKREWVKQAQAANDQLQKDVIAIQKSRAPFLAEFEALDKHSNTFYQTKGFVRGKIDGLVKDLRADVAREKESRIATAKQKAAGDNMPVNYYDVQIEAIEDDVRRFDREVEQFRLDVKAIGEVDRSLSERLKVMDRHITDAGKSGEQGAAELEKMWWMIDDTKARTAYYQIKGYAEHAASVREYVEGPLMNDFKQVGETLKKQIAQVQTQIDDLEQRGLIVEHRAKRLLQKKRAAEAQEKLDAAMQDDQEEAQPRRRRKKAQKRSWFGMIFAPFSWTMSGISLAGAVVVAPFKFVYDFFFGGARTPRKRRKASAST